MEGQIRIRFSDLKKYTPYQIVIDNIENNMMFQRKFLKFKAFFPFDERKRYFEIIFPKYSFRDAFVRIPTSTRRKAGRFNVLIEFTKEDKGKIKINKYEKYIKKR